VHPFDQDIAVERVNSQRYKASITANWSINGVPNGGYLMALITNALMQSSRMRATPIITVNFLNRCQPGDAIVSVERMSRSRRFDRLEARLEQNGEERIRAFGTFTDENDECALESYQAKAPDIRNLEACINVPEMPDIPLFGQVDIRLDPGCAGWAVGRLSDRSEIKGWIKLKTDRPFDVLSILLAADAFPPAVFTSQGMVAWVPTIECSVNIRNLPTSEWLKCLFRTRFITCGLLEEDGEIWDEGGTLVAISRQIAQYRSQQA
jgi:acyl-CoA thioesterase